MEQLFFKAVRDGGKSPSGKGPTYQLQPGAVAQAPKGWNIFLVRTPAAALARVPDATEVWVASPGTILREDIKAIATDSCTMVRRFSASELAQMIKQTPERVEWASGVVHILGSNGQESLDRAVLAAASSKPVLASYLVLYAAETYPRTTREFQEAMIRAVYATPALATLLYHFARHVPRANASTLSKAMIQAVKTDPKQAPAARWLAESVPGADRDALLKVYELATAN